MKDKLRSSLDRYPAGPVTLIVPTTADGSPDMVARAMAKVAAKYLGQPLLISNISGQGAILGWDELAGTKPDGYVIGAVATGLILQPLYTPTKYHYPTALDALVQVASLPVAIAVLSEQPWQSIEDLIKSAQEHPGQIKFGHMGLGTPRHVVGEMFAQKAGIDIRQVPFDGGREALTALLSGQVQLIFTDHCQVKEQVKDGKVRVLAFTTEQRLSDPLFKNVPTFKELGFDIVFDLWLGVAAPKGLPQDIKAKLVEGLTAMIHDDEFKKNMEDLGTVVNYLGAHDFAGKWIAESTRLTKCVRDTGIAERIATQKREKSFAR